MVVDGAVVSTGPTGGWRPRGWRGWPRERYSTGVRGRAVGAHVRGGHAGVGVGGLQGHVHRLGVGAGRTRRVVTGDGGGRRGGVTWTTWVLTASALPALSQERYFTVVVEPTSNG